MKYQDFLKLNEDEGGGGESVGNVTGNAETDNSTGWVTTGSTLYTRLAMPQIPKEMKQQFRDDLELNGYSIKPKKMKCSDLMPTQSEFNDDKVNAICKSIKDGTYEDEPILVAKDNKIADGHHRWKGKVAANHDEISTEYVDMTFDDLYKFLDNKVYVVKRDV